MERKDPRIGVKHSPERIEKNRLSHLGRKHTEEQKKKTSETLKRMYREGKIILPEWTDEKRKKMSETHKRNGHKPIKPFYAAGEQATAWLGEKARYVSKHSWITKKRGRPDKCEHCGDTSKNHRSYHWANVDHKYSRDVNDYVRLCAKCHYKYDKANGLRR